LTGEFHEHVEEKATAFKNIGTQIVPHVVFDEFLNPLQRIRVVANSFENNTFPDAHGLFVNGVPDILFAGKMAVETAFRQISGLDNIADRGVVIAFDGKKLHGFFDDFATGAGAFGCHCCLVFGIGCFVFSILKCRRGILYFAAETKANSVLIYRPVFFIYLVFGMMSITF